MRRGRIQCYKRNPHAAARSLSNHVRPVGCRARRLQRMRERNRRVEAEGILPRRTRRSAGWAGGKPALVGVR